MPRNVAQFAGIIVTSIVVMGADVDVVYAIPFGILAGTLATFFVALADERQRVRA